MSAIEAGAQAPESPWRDEIRATLSLSWPMVLTNLAQIAMTATDVMMMGRAGPGMLAAGALGANLYFAPLIFGLGLMNATLADDGGRARPQPPFGARHPPHRAARPVDRRAGLHPDLADPVEHRGDPRRHGAGSGAGQGGRRLRALAAMGGAAVLRLHRAALVHGGARAAALGAGHRGHRGDLQRLRQLVPDLRQSRLSREWASPAPGSPPRCRAS